MIITLTPNPSLDRTVTLDGELVRGGVNRLATVTVEPGGKGLNVARVLVSSGEPVTTVLPADEHDPLLRVLEAVSSPELTTVAVPVRGAARINTAVTEPDGTTTKLNEPGAGLSDSEVCAVEEALVAAAGTADGAGGRGDARQQEPPAARSWAVLSGSLPPGAPTDWYVQLVRRLRRARPELSIAVDTSDEPLAVLAEALPEAAPDLIKPNGQELGQLAGVPRADAMALEEGAMHGELGPVVEAARVLVERGITEVLATLGAAGAVLVSGRGAWHATAPAVAVRSTVGAGDSSVAGYVLADVRGGDEATRLTSAMAYGSAAASLPGTRLPRPGDLPEEASIITRLS